MDLINLMKSLTVSETVEENNTNIHVFGVEIKGVHTDIVFGQFTNKYLIIATQYEKAGSLLQVTIDEAENGVNICPPTYNITSLFGSENIEQFAAVRYIAENLKIRKPLKIFLCLKNYEADTVKALVEALLNTPREESV